MMAVYPQVQGILTSMQA